MENEVREAEQMAGEKRAAPAGSSRGELRSDLLGQGIWKGRGQLVKIS